MKSLLQMNPKKSAIIVIMFLTSFCQVLAIDINIDKIIYTIDSETGTAKVKGCMDDVTTLKIPQEVSYNETTYTVTEIGNSAFSGNKSITSVTIPSTVVKINYKAFYECSAITSIVLPQSITSIAEFAFSGCSSIESITFPSSIQKIGNNAFNGCISLKSISFLDGDNPLQLGYNTTSSYLGLFGDSQINYVYIGRNLISTYYRTFLNANIPNLLIEFGTKVTSLPDYCFAWCKGLNSIKLPPSLSSIGEYCFLDCNNLDSIILPGNLQTIKSYALYGCSNLEYIDYTPTDKFATIEEHAFEDEVLSSKQLVIHNAEKAIEATYDSEWSKFHNIVFKTDTNTFIPINWNYELLSDNAIFSNELGCLVPLGQSTTFRVNKDVLAFHLEKEISDELNSKSGYTILPDSYWAFNRFFVYTTGENNKDVSLSEPGTLFNILGLQSIQAIQGLTISGNINGTDIMTINKMNNLKYLNLKNANIVEGGKTYRENYQTKNNTVGTDFLYNLTNLQTLILPTTCKVLEENALKDMSSIYNIVLGDSLEIINESAFDGCSSLFSISIPSKVKKILLYAFSGCKNLSNIHFDDSNSYISIFTNYKCPFYGSPLEKLYIGRNIYYTTYNTSDGLFSNSKNLRTLKFGNNVTEISEYMFEGCQQLENIDFPINLKTIGEKAFYNCSNLSEVTIPNTVSIIPDYSFSYCVNLSKITLGSGIKTISDYAFIDCSNVQKLLSLAEIPPVISDKTFSSINKETCQLLVTKGNLVNYWLDPIWSQFINLSDELYYLNPLPDAKYGDDYIDLADYAPKGISFKYESSNPDIANIDGTLLKINGAGTATIAAIIPEAGTPMELIGQMRQFNISKSDLKISVKDVTITEGETINGFEYIADGLCYDDSIEDIEKLPIPKHEVTKTSAPGIYPITFTKGYDNNYNIVTTNAKITVIASEGSIDSIQLDENSKTEVFTIEGIKVHEGSLSNIHLPSGVYIIKQGSVVKKIHLTN